MKYEYIQNFWSPLKGHTVEYKDKQYIIDKIIDDVQIKLRGFNRIGWIQDMYWVPSIDEIDNEVVHGKLKAKIIGSSIRVVSKSGKFCYFLKPGNLTDYENIIREIRVFLTINGN